VDRSCSRDDFCLFCANVLYLAIRDGLLQLPRTPRKPGPKGERGLELFSAIEARREPIIQKSLSKLQRQKALEMARAGKFPAFAFKPRSIAEAITLLQAIDPLYQDQGLNYLQKRYHEAKKAGAAGKRWSALIRKFVRN
jgi:hypothetical protein